MGIRPARLEPLALSASGRERMVNGRAAASGEKRIDLSVGIAWFGDILKKGAARRDRAPFGLCQFGGRCQAVASGEGLRTTYPAGLAWGVGRETGEQWPGGRWGPPTFPGCQEVGSPFRSQR